MDKENAVPENGTRTPPALVPLSKRKSSVKRVRFSLDQPGEACSPVRLNRDIIPIEHRNSISRSSVGSNSSPMHFPSQEDLLAEPPAGSPGDSRQSTGSSLNGGNVLVSALNSFGASNIPSAPVRSIWDTPSSADEIPRSAASPAMRSSLARGETPGGAERRFFGFQVVEEDQNNNNSRHSLPPDREEAPVRVEPLTNSPRRKSFIFDNQDDPLLMSGASSAVKALSSATPRRRRRRLSSLEEIESELMNVSSPEHAATTVHQLLAREGVVIDRLLACRQADIGYLLQSERAPVGEWENVKLPVNDANVLNVCNQQLKAVELSIDSTIHWVLEMIAQAKDTLRRISSAGSPNFVASEHLAGLIDREKRKAELLRKTVHLCLLENQESSLSQTGKVLFKYGQELEEVEGELVKFGRECDNLLENITCFKSEMEPEMKHKFAKTLDGQLQRIKSEEEIRFDKVEKFVKAKETEIGSVIEEITQLESTVAEKEKVFSQDLERFRHFYEKNGWNVIAELNKSTVLIYCVCHILVFEKAVNDERFWRLDRIVPAKFDLLKPPHYAKNWTSKQVKCNPEIVLEQIIVSNGLRTPFKYDASLLHALMGAATAALCEWVQLRDFLGQIQTSPESRIKINSNMQIEAVVVAPNSALGVEVPLAVKLLWFDPLFIEQHVKYDNFSYILTEPLLSSFSSVRDQLDKRFASLKEDSSSLRMLSEIVRAVQSVLINAQPC